MDKRKIGVDIPLLFACSGGSPAALFVDRVARKLADAGLVYMSCVPAVTARIEHFLEKLKTDEKVIVLDGCFELCVAKTLELSGFRGYARISLSDLGIEKSAVEPDDEAQIERVCDHIAELIRDDRTWSQHRFSYDEGSDCFRC